MTTPGWARVAAVSSAATLALFVVALLAMNAAGPRVPGPYTVALRVLLVVVGIVLAMVTAWRYERLARGQVQGRPRWRVFTAWWALVVISVLIVVGFPPSLWAELAWCTGLGWAVAATCAARLDRATQR